MLKYRVIIITTLKVFLYSLDIAATRMFPGLERMTSCRGRDRADILADGR